VTDLHTKYRPENFDQIIGNEALVASLKEQLKKGNCHAFIFSGPSGCGKTTLARIIARESGCENLNIIEVDAATHTGVDAMRNLCDRLAYAPIGNSTGRALIVDEAHRLSAAAWSSLLKSVEEPPTGTFWMFCTTDPSKIPVTIKTRCSEYKVSALKTGLLFDYMRDIAEAEEWKVPDAIIQRIARESEGSPRQALVFLSMTHRCKTEKECAELIQSGVESKDVRELCQLLLGGKGLTWTNLMKIVLRLNEEEPETIRLGIMGYMAKVSTSESGNRVTLRALEIMEAFSNNFYGPDKKAQFLLSLGRIVFSK